MQKHWRLRLGALQEASTVRDDIMFVHAPITEATFHLPVGPPANRATSIPRSLSTLNCACTERRPAADTLPGSWTNGILFVLVVLVTKQCSGENFNHGHEPSRVLLVGWLTGRPNSASQFLVRGVDQPPTGERTFFVATRAQPRLRIPGVQQTSDDGDAEDDDDDDHDWWCR